MTSDHKQLLKTWIAALLWMALIAIESTDTFSAEHTSRFLYPLLHFLMGLDPAGFEVVHHYIRKCGHFVGYFTLSFFLFRAWRATLRLPWAPAWALRWSVIAFFMSVLVASLDEWHQTFIPSRTGAIKDVVLDSSAALTAQLLIFLYLTWKPRRMIAVGD
ncbi:MAG TPA: VanZ family protein [Terriglobales bacterium]|nr:VanZ family protein [Terriglobales bacterium]